MSGSLSKNHITIISLHATSGGGYHLHSLNNSALGKPVTECFILSATDQLNGPLVGDPIRLQDFSNLFRGSSFIHRMKYESSDS
jgi:hypothetical protein